MKMKMKSVLFGLAAVISFAGSASAQSVIFNSSSVNQYGTPFGPDQTNQAGWVRHVTTAYWAQQALEVGGKIQFAGTDRLAHAATVQLRTGANPACSTPLTCPSFAVPGPVTLKLNFYNINVDGTMGSIFGSQQQVFNSPAAIDDINTPFVNEGRPFYNAIFDLSSFGLLPNEVYYGVELLTPELNATTQSTNLSLWNYALLPGTGLIDGPVIKVGTDLSKQVWRRGPGFGGVAPVAIDGFTPNLIVTASTVPEPSTYVLMMAGLAGLFAVQLHRRRA